MPVRLPVSSAERPWRTARGASSLSDRVVKEQSGGVAAEALKARVRQECPPPWEIDFRMSVEGDDLYIPPQAAQ